MEIFIEFTKPKGKILPVYSWLIRVFENTPYSHVRIRWINSTGIELIYEASGRSVKLIGKKAQPKHQVTVVDSFKVTLNQNQYRKMIKLFRFAGVDYGIKQAFGILITKLFKLKRNPLSQGRSSQVCSELVALFLMEVVGITYLDLMIDLDTVSPKQLHELLGKVYPHA